MNQNPIENLRTFIDGITGAPLPTIRHAGIDFYLGLESIRCEAVSQICADHLQRCADVDRARQALEPIRLELVHKYPGCADMLDSATWPNLRINN